MSGYNFVPMLITRDVNNPGALISWLETNASTLVDGFIFGGTAAVSTAAETAMETAAGVDTTGPGSTYLKQTNGALALSGILDNTDTIRVVFNEQMAAPDNGDKIRFTDGDGTVVDVTCGAGTATCSLNSSAETVDSVSRPTNTVLTLVLTADPTVITVGTAAGEQVATGAATDQAGNTDLSSNGWDLGAVSTDKSLS